MFGLPKKTSALLARSKPIFYSCTLIVASRFHNETTCTYVILNMNIVLLLFVAELNFKLVMARTGVNLSKGLLTQAKLSYHCVFFHHLSFKYSSFNDAKNLQFLKFCVLLRGWSSVIEISLIYSFKLQMRVS